MIDKLTVYNAIRHPSPKFFVIRLRDNRGLAYGATRIAAEKAKVTFSRLGVACKVVGQSGYVVGVGDGNWHTDGSFHKTGEDNNAEKH